MSKFKNKKALALSVGAIMAGVSVIGVVAACAPTKAKPAKPTEKKVEQPQTGGNESSNPGSGNGNTTNPTGQGSGTGGSTNANPGSGNSSNAGNQGSGNGGTTDSLGGSTNDNNQKSEQEAQAALTAKKTQTKEKISKLAYLSEADKKSFNDQVDAIADPSKINEADEIVKQAELKNNEEKTKKEQADKQKEAEATLKTKKEEANNTINALANLTPEERKEFTDNVDKITDTTKSEEINKIVEEAKTKDTEKKNAKEAATKLEEEKQNAIAEINKLQALEESERAPFVQKIEAIKTVDQKEEIQKTLKEAKDANAKKVAAKAKKEAEEVKSSLTPVSIRIENDKYIWLKLKTTNQTFSKIEAKRLKFTLNNGKGGEFVENAAGFGPTNKTIYYQNKKVESDGSVTFEISSDQKYGAENEKGTWKVTQVWLSDDTTETNLLTKQSDELTIS
ncbi:hypothetical protein JM47_01870 [Ureaplasma diversum]|uniref:Protein G-related albumin-binding (GA) module domain-containing protein n=1 Tax=Ureaplasma diversum TaxID=42094 RepID=A0A0C5RPJ7_9BACT|nr:GA module-containing protein [Ureaplasma diversum]AJQ45339.1 hypothetical protein JM47_01870 [Ureaplasma diversum]